MQTERSVDMSSVVVTAIFTPVEGQKAELIKALQASVPAVHEEEGCELYAIHDADDGTVVMIEKWASREDLERHNHGAAGAALMGRIRHLLARAVTVNKMDPVMAGHSHGTL
jgi:quinol monooxygenase YgiN